MTVLRRPKIPVFPNKLAIAFCSLLKVKQQRQTAKREQTQSVGSITDNKNEEQTKKGGLKLGIEERTDERLGSTIVFGDIPRDHPQLPQRRPTTMTSATVAVVRVGIVADNG